MKKIAVFLVGTILMIIMVSLSNASEMDKGSMKGSAMEQSKDKASAAVVVEKKADSAQWAEPNKAWAMIKGTQEDSEITGRADLVETGDGVQVVINVSKVTPPGKHGIHIHENGSCEEGGKAAGGHFNPDGADHGLLQRDGHEKAHTGDMGNIVIKDDGSGMLNAFLPGLSLTAGSKNVTGKAVILHAKEDDFGQPTGNAGGRIGCGVIEFNK